MNNPSEFTKDIPDLVKEQARALSDNATANGMPMNFDAALAHTVALDAANRLPILPLVGEPCLQDLTPEEIFTLADALDITMQYDPEEKRRYDSASLVVDLQTSLHYLPGADASARKRILASVLKIDDKSPTASQLAERYFGASTEVERDVVTSFITNQSRTVRT